MCYDTVMKNNLIAKILLVVLALLFGTGLTWRLTHKETVPEEPIVEETIEEVEE